MTTFFPQPWRWFSAKAKRNLSNRHGNFSSIKWNAPIISFIIIGRGPRGKKPNCQFHIIFNSGRLALMLIACAASRIASIVPSRGVLIASVNHSFTEHHTVQSVVVFSISLYIGRYFHEKGFLQFHFSWIDAGFKFVKTTTLFQSNLYIFTCAVQ